MVAVPVNSVQDRHRSLGLDMADRHSHLGEELRNQTWVSLRMVAVGNRLGKNHRMKGENRFGSCVKGRWGRDSRLR